MTDDQSALLEELQRRFPSAAGFEIEEATHVQLVDGRQKTSRVLIVSGRGVALTFHDGPRASEG